MNRCLMVPAVSALFTTGLVSMAGAQRIVVSADNHVAIGNGSFFASGFDQTGFGKVGVSGQEATHRFTITNTSRDTPLSFFNLLSKSGTDAADFSISAFPVTPLASAQSRSFEVTFNPSSEGPKAAQINIATDDPDNGNFTFRITGEGSDGTFQEAPDLAFVNVVPPKLRTNTKKDEMKITWSVSFANLSKVPTHEADLRFYRSNDEFLDSSDALLSAVFVKSMPGAVLGKKEKTKKSTLKTVVDEERKGTLFAVIQAVPPELSLPQNNLNSVIRMPFSKDLAL